MSNPSAPRSAEAPLVSVITIFLNEERFLAEAVESVLAQTYPRWELLLCDDGSTDDSTALARAYVAAQPDRIRYLEHAGHANRGMSATRNLGVAAARGEFVAFLDADDVYEPEKLERQVALLQSQPGAAMVCGPNLLWYSWTADPADAGRDHQSRIGVPAERVIPGQALLSSILSGRGEPPGTCSVLVRREAILSVGGFEDAFRGMFEDQVFLAKLLLQHDVYVMRESFDRYRQHADSECNRALASGEHHLDLPTAAARDHYLPWLQAYLAGREASARVRWLVRRELWFARHPTLARLRQAVTEALGRAYALSIGVAFTLGRRLLPERFREQLWQGWLASRTSKPQLDRSR
jgi:glycosyltransferase involved in cell wall biosynthesis